MKFYYLLFIDILPTKFKFYPILFMLIHYNIDFIFLTEIVLLYHQKIVKLLFKSENLFTLFINYIAYKLNIFSPNHARENLNI